MEQTNYCRICFDEETEDNKLIKPCRCNSFVHERCLQIWRYQNINNDNFEKCEICLESYVIFRKYPLEKSQIKFITKYKRYEIVLFYILFALGCEIVIGCLDYITGNFSIYLLSFGNSNTFFTDYKIYDPSSIIYYTSYSNYIFIMFFFVIYFFYVVNNVINENRYWEKCLRHFTINFFLSWNYFYNYYIFYIGMQSIETYLFACCCCLFLNYYIIKNQLLFHNKIIKSLNDEARERILCPQFNPIMEFTAVQIE